MSRYHNIMTVCVIKFAYICREFRPNYIYSMLNQKSMKQITKDFKQLEQGSASVNSFLYMLFQRAMVELVEDAVPELVSKAVPLVVSKATGQNQEAESKYIYGLEGIRKEFGVGHNTAQRLKDGVLREAVLQAGPGCKILVDRELARKLFAEYIKKEGTR